MPTPTKGPRLGGSPQHERLILRNLAQSLFEHGKISTTEAKAKKLRPFAEKLITHAKRGDLHARREALKVIRDKAVVHKLFAEIGPSFATREGGYTRIVKTAPRKGDNAPMAIIELILEETVSASAGRTARRAARTAGSAPATRTGSSPAPAVEVAADHISAEDIPANEVFTDDQATQAEQAVDEAPAEGAVDGVSSSDAPDETHPHGPGSHAPLPGDAQPEGFPVKGNADSNLYHLPDTRFYDSTVAEVWFASAADAEAAGFSLPKSQQ